MLSSPSGTRPVDRALFQLTRLIGTDLRRWPRVRLPTMLVARFSPRVTTRGDFSTGNNVEKEIGRPSYVISKVWSGLAYRAAPHVPRLCTSVSSGPFRANHEAYRRSLVGMPSRRPKQRPRGRGSYFDFVLASTLLLPPDSIVPTLWTFQLPEYWILPFNVFPYSLDTNLEHLAHRQLDGFQCSHSERVASCVL